LRAVAPVPPPPPAPAPPAPAAIPAPTPPLPSLDSINAELARRYLHEFVVQAWPIVEPDRAYADNWHIRTLCDVLASVTRGDIKRLIINVSPGTMKSLLVSVFWPAWEWATQPQLRYLTASYGAHLTTRDNLRLRAIITSQWYQTYFPLTLQDDQNQKTRFNTTEGGWRIASSVGGVGTGEHPDRIIIDDPLTAEQARSDIERVSCNTWFDRTISSRGITRDTRVVVVMQRLHENDLSGHLLARGGWTHICWPMRYETTRANDPSFRPDPRDPRTVPGELFWPSLFTDAIVRRLELDLGPYGSAGQLQQRPAPEGGGLFKREWFKFVDAEPAGARRARGWDTAGTEGAGDWTVGVRISEYSGRFYVEDVRRERAGPAGVDSLILQTARSDGITCAQREEKEGGASGVAVIAARARLLAGYDYAGVPISGDKITRAKPFRAQCEAGNVSLVRGDWNESYIRELCEFPTGSHDDQVDASSAAFNAVLLEPAPRVYEATWGRSVASR
jgi:predicted phage terminase large subunit-like protein